METNFKIPPPSPLRIAYQNVRNIIFLENFPYVLNEWSHVKNTRTKGNLKFPSLLFFFLCIIFFTRLCFFMLGFSWSFWWYYITIVPKASSPPLVIVTSNVLLAFVKMIKINCSRKVIRSLKCRRKSFSGLFLFVFVCVADFGKMLSSLYNLDKSIP